MATISHFFSPADAAAPASGFASYRVRQGTNIPVPGLDFEAAAVEAAFFYFRAVAYGSGNLTVTIDWYADSASSGDVIWGVQIACITPNTDTQDIETDTLATANTATDSHLGTTGQRLHTIDVTVSNLDSIAAGDYVAVRVFRDAAAGGDTMTGDATIVGVQISYSDV